MKTHTRITAIIFLFCCLLLAALLPLFQASTPMLSMPQQIFGTDSIPVITYSDAPNGSQISIYSNNGATGDHLLSQTAHGNGSIELSGLSLSEGRYFAELSHQGTLLSRIDFTVTAAQLYTEKESYQLGEPVILHYPQEFSDGSWIGIYREGDTPGEDVSLLWETLDTSSDGTMLLQNMGGTIAFLSSDPGTYCAYLFDGTEYDIQLHTSFTLVWNTENQIVYRRTASVRGLCDGWVQLILADSTQKADSYQICWGSDGAVLENYTVLAAIDGSKEMLGEHFPANCVIPPEASQLIIRETSSGKYAAVLDLPKSYLLSDEEPLFSFAVFSDMHVTDDMLHRNNKQFANALWQAEVLLEEPAALVLLGDLTNNGKAAEYKQLNILLDAGADSFPELLYAIGNHDLALNQCSWEEQVGLFQKFTGMENVYYRAEIADCPALFLGSENAEGYQSSNAILSDEQYAWLEAELRTASEENPDRPIFLFLHQPLGYTVSGTADGSDVIPSGKFTDLILQYPQAILFSGHTHFEMGVQRTVVQSTVGTSFVHAGSISELWDGESNLSGSQGMFVSVYQDYLLLQARDFISKQWISSGQSLIRWGLTE